MIILFMKEEDDDGNGLNRSFSFIVVGTMTPISLSMNGMVDGGGNICFGGVLPSSSSSSSIYNINE